MLDAVRVAAFVAVDAHATRVESATPVLWRKPSAHRYSIHPRPVRPYESNTAHLTKRARVFWSLSRFPLEHRTLVVIGNRSSGCFTDCIASKSTAAPETSANRAGAMAAAGIDSPWLLDLDRNGVCLPIGTTVSFAGVRAASERCEPDTQTT